MSERVIKGYHAHIYYDPANDARCGGREVRAGLTQFQRPAWPLA